MIIQNANSILRPPYYITMEQEFNIKNGWKIFCYALCVIVIGITLYFLVDALLSHENVTLWIGINLGATLLLGYGIVAIYRGKVVLTSDAIIECRAFRQKKLLFSEIKGFRIQGVMIVLEPRDRSKSRLVVGNISYIINGTELAEFLVNEFKDLDKSDYDTEVSEAFNNPAIGDSVPDRERRIKTAKRVARFLNLGGVAVMIWLLIPTSYYYLPIIVGLFYPLIVLTYFFARQQIVALLDTGKLSVHPNLTVALYLSVGGLGLRVLLLYQALYVADCILPIAVLFVVLTLLFVLLLRPARGRKSNLWTGIFFFLFYSASTIGMVNCSFDYSRPVEYRAKVLKHWILHKPTSYNVELDAWALRKETAVETVSHATYDQIKDGDWVTVYVKKGYLNIPWYFVE